MKHEFLYVCFSLATTITTPSSEHIITSPHDQTGTTQNHKFVYKKEQRTDSEKKADQPSQQLIH